MSRSGPGESLESLVGRVADEYTERQQRGEDPDIEDYAQRYPQIADLIRQVLPTLRTLQTLGGSGASLAEPVGADGSVRGILGDFQILQEIGRGGMGIVYEAEQISLGRRVALKVLPFAAVLDPRQLQRFRNEAQAAAQLHHTNIVPVYTVGCERGVYFYAMQYIAGQTLADVIAELRGLTGLDPSQTPDLPAPVSEVTSALVQQSSALDGSWQERLPADHPIATDASSELHTAVSGGSIRSRTFFLSVARIGVEAAEALDHAHRLGVIHRDIKPSNLLLDAQGKIWITDFGLANIRSTELTLTMPGDVLGTLRYMSPQQAQGGPGVIDHRTDVYSLGATLYELATLRPAFAGHDRHDLLHRIIEQEPPLPRQLNDAIPSDLQTILLKAMAKDPAERYTGAAAMAEDLRRFQEHRPIMARPPTVVERLAKWCRRHTAGVVTALAALLLIAVGLGVSTVLVAREQKRTAGALASSQEQRRRSDAHLKQALESVDRMLTRVGQAEMANVPLKVRRQWLADALQFYEGFLQEQGAGPQVRLEATRTYRRTGDIRRMLGDQARAEQDYHRGIDLLTSPADADSVQPECQYELAMCYRQLGLLQAERQGAEQGRPALASSTTILASLAAAFPRTARYWHPLALDYLDTGQLSQAEEALQRAMSLQEEATDDPLNAPHAREALAQASSDLGRVLQQAGQFQRATAAYQKALNLYGGLASQPDPSRYLGQTGNLHLFIGRTHLQTGQYEQAESQLREAVAVLKQAAQESSDLTSAESPLRNLAYACGSLSDVLKQTEQPWEAMKVLREGLTIHAELQQRLPHLPGLRSDYQAARTAQDQMLAQTGYYRFLPPANEEEEAIMRDSVALLERAVEQAPQVAEYREQLARTLLGLGLVAQKNGLQDEALELYVRVRGLYQHLAEVDPGTQRHREYLAICCRVIGQVQLSRGHKDLAEEADSQAVATWRTLQDDPKTRERYVGNLLQDLPPLAAIVFQRGRPGEAERLYRESLAIYEQARRDFPDLEQSWANALAVVCMWNGLADVMVRTNRLEDASQYFAKAASYAHDRTAGHEAPDLFAREETHACRCLAEILQRLGRPAEATDALVQAVRSCEAAVARFPDARTVTSGLIILRIRLATQLWDLQRPQEAETATGQVIQVMDDLAADVKILNEPLNMAHADDRVLTGALVDSLVREGRISLAEHLARRTIRAQQRVAERFPKVWYCRTAVNQLYRVLGGIHRAAGRLEDAMTAIRSAIADQEQVVAECPDDRWARHTLALAWRNLAQVLQPLGHPDEAEQAYRQATTMHSLLVKDYPEEAEFPRNLSADRAELADLLRLQGRLQDAEVIRRDALDQAGSAPASQPRATSVQSDLAR